MSSIFRIGFIGLGKMGTPMCKRLAATGHAVTAYARNAQGRDKAAALGVPSVSSLAGLANGVDVIVSAVTNDDALRDIVAGPDGLAASFGRSHVFIETSTVSPRVSAEVAGMLSAKGTAYIRSPISGSTATAEAGQLTVLSSGPRAAFDAALPLFEAFSKKQYHVGAGEEARYLKLTLNAMVGATSALIAEALTLAARGGLDLATTLDVINNSAVASPLIGYKTRMMITGDYAPAFPVSGMIKDFDLALGVGRDEHLPLPLIAQVRQQYEAAFAGGNGEDDFFVLVQRAAAAAGLGRKD